MSSGAFAPIPIQRLPRLLTFIKHYVAFTVDQPLSPEDAETLQQSVENEETSERMKSFFDLFEEKGKLEGKIEGKIETIQDVASVRFQGSPKRLNKLLTQFDDLDLLEKTRQFTLVAPSLPALETFAENLLQIKPKTKRVAKRKAL